MLRDEGRRSGPRQEGRPDTNSTTASITSWTEVYEDAERWVCWSARRRWPAFTCNDQIWAASVTSWELHGRKAAA